MPMLLSSAVKESCCRRRIKDYLDNEFGRSPGRAIAWDYVNLSERESKHWDEVMDATRKEYGHDKDWHGRASRQYTHFIISPDPRDAVDIDTLRELTTRWVAEFFGGPTDDDWNHVGILGDYQVAIAYHDDNTNHVPHAHVIVNATNLHTGKKMEIKNDINEHLMPERLQEIANELGLSYFDDEGLNVVRTEKKLKNKSLTSTELRLVQEAKFSWKDELRSRIDIAKCISGTEEDFINALDEMGVGVRQSKEREDDWVYYDNRNPRYWECRGFKLGAEYKKTSIERYRRKLRGQRFVTDTDKAQMFKERQNVLESFKESVQVPDRPMETAGEIIDRVAEQFADKIIGRTFIKMYEHVDVNDLAEALKTNRDYDVQCFEDYDMLMEGFARWARLEGASLEDPDNSNAIAYRRLWDAQQIAAKGDLFAGATPKPTLPRPITQPKKDPLRKKPSGYKGSSSSGRGRSRGNTQSKRQGKSR